jgi:hypothetical protein
MNLPPPLPSYLFRHSRMRLSVQKLLDGEAGVVQITGSGELDT